MLAVSAVAIVFIVRAVHRRNQLNLAGRGHFSALYIS